MEDMASTAVDRSPIGIAAAVVPIVSLVAVAAAWSSKPSAVVLILLGLLLVGSVLTAVHHAEVVALKIGEPFGSILLAVAVTIIEVGLIIMLTLSGKASGTLARDTVFAAVMITCNIIFGLVLLLGALRRRVAEFNRPGTTAALATVVTLTALCLILPTFTSTATGPIYAPSQLAFAAVASLALYVLFVFVQSVRHRDYFLPTEATDLDQDDHADPPTRGQTLLGVALLVISLIAVVGLAKVESPAIEAGVETAGLPVSFVGIVIALLVLLPETIAAARNARRDRVQTGVNLALGSAMASIGLTVPALALASIWLPGQLQLGLGSLQIALFAVTAIVGSLTIIPGRATVQQGALHLVIGAAFLYFSAIP